MATLWLAAAPLGAQQKAPFDAATAFGARPSVTHASLSPDGMSIAFVAPSMGLGSILYTHRLDKEGTPHAALAVNGAPERLGRCGWVSNERLVCTVYGVVHSAQDLFPFTPGGGGVCRRQQPQAVES
jgi:hypothetical protein